MDTTDLVFYSLMGIVAVIYLGINLYRDSGDDDFPGWPLMIGSYLLGIVFGMGIFLILFHYVHVCFALLWSTFLISLPWLLGTDGDEEVEYAREVLDVTIGEGLPHGEGITGDE